MRCPRCKNKLLQKFGTRVRVRTKGPLVFTEDGKCSAQCYWCGEPVAVPLELRKGPDDATDAPNLPARASDDSMRCLLQRWFETGSNRPSAAR